MISSSVGGATLLLRLLSLVLLLAVSGCGGDENDIRGKWNIVEMRVEGGGMYADLRGSYTFADSLVTVAFETGGDEPAINIGRYVVDPGTNPQRIHLGFGNTVYIGIYAIDGDELTLCVIDREDGDWPTTFDAEERSGRTLVRFERD